MPRLLNPYSIAAFSFSVISTFKHTPPHSFWYRRRPHADGSDIYNALLRCKPPSPFQVIWTKTIVIQGPGTGGRLCSPNLRFWRPALSIELHPYIYHLFDGMLRVGSGFPGACLWSSPKLYDHGFTAGALFFPYGYSYSLPVLPHGGCDPPARIVGWIHLRHIFPQGG